MFVEELKNILLSWKAVSLFALFNLLVFLLPQYFSSWLIDGPSSLEHLLIYPGLFKVFMRFWFKFVTAPIEFLLLPAMLTHGLLNGVNARQSLRRYRNLDLTSNLFLKNRFTAVVFSVVILIGMSQYLGYLHFSRLLPNCPSRLFTAIIYLTTLGSVFAVTVYFAVATFIKSPLLATAVGSSIILIFLAPFILNNTHLLSSKIKMFSPFHYSSYIIFEETGHIFQFVHSTTILFFFILLFYEIAARNISR